MASIGMVIGDTTLISQSEKSGYWNALCRCGRKFVAAPRDLLRSSAPGLCKCSNKLWIGKRVADLTVVAETTERAANQNKKYLFQCVCGNTLCRAGGDVTTGKIKSCGCLMQRKKPTTAESSNAELETRWRARHSGMLARCLNPNSVKFQSYGLRGITVDDDLKKFANYAAFMDSLWQAQGRPESFLVDREQVDGNYSKSNLRLLSSKDSANNKTNTIFVTYQGESMPLSKAAELSGIARHTLSERLARGDAEDRLFRPVKIDWRVTRHSLKIEDMS